MIEYALGEDGHSYLAEALSQCSGAAHNLLRTIANPGRVYAPLPRQTIVGREKQFDIGGLASRSEALDWLFWNLTRKPAGTFVLQDIWSIPSDIERRKPNYRWYFTDDRNVYYYLNSTQITLGSLLELSKATASFQEVGFFVTGGINLTPEEQSGHRVSFNRIQNWFDLTTAVYLSAYDRDSWIVWESAEN